MLQPQCRKGVEDLLEFTKLGLSLMELNSESIEPVSSTLGAHKRIVLESTSI